jgi:hypothetical protein
MEGMDRIPPSVLLGVHNYKACYLLIYSILYAMKKLSMISG